jgi:hypothetical protein
MSDMPQLQEHVNAASTAMLVMDYQNGVLASVDGAEELLARAADALDAVRKAGVTVGYVRVALTSEELAAVPATNKTFARLASGGLSVDADSPATAVPDDLAPRAGDIVVRKTRVGAFSPTNLHRHAHPHRYCHQRRRPFHRSGRRRSRLPAPPRPRPVRGSRQRRSRDARHEGVPPPSRRGECRRSAGPDRTVNL